MQALKLLAGFFASFILADKLPLAAVLSPILEAEPEEEGMDPPMVDAGDAHEWLFDVLKRCVRRGRRAVG